jgi:membrane-bound lytic murein transglycosylase D
MKNSILVKIACVQLLLFSISNSWNNSLFPVPENLEDNVTFWKTIYTKVSLQEGLLHDRDYPLIIYDTLQVGYATGKKLDVLLSKHKKKIASIIKAVKTKSYNQWGDEEKKLATLFKNAPKGALDSAEHRIRFQLGQKERFLDGLQRSGAYIDTIKAILLSHGLPEILAFLPHVESSYNVDAYSKVGASGIWQFMPETGKRFLTINNSIDERNDPIRSSIAAAKLLRINYKNLKTWPLALTAYNYGLSGMMRAVKKSGSTDLGIVIEKHESPIFRFASKNFYSCFIAAAQIAENPLSYFDKVVFSKPKPYNDLTLSKALTSEEIANAVGITEKEFKSMNLAIRSSIIKNKLKIPAGTVIRIDKKITGDELMQRISTYFKIPVPEKKQKFTTKEDFIPFQFELAFNEMSINKIPNDASNFSDVNKKINSGNKQNSSTGILVTELKKTKSNFANINVFRSTSNDSSFIKPGIVSEGNCELFELEIIGAEKAAVVTVLTDENVGLYAKWSGIAVGNIIRYNKLKNRTHLHVGQKIRIPLERLVISQFTNSRREYHTDIRNKFFKRFKIESIKTRILKEGENVWNICNNGSNMPLWLLQHLNKKVDFNKIRPGTRLQWPVIVRVS